jgi:hypothetical protein
MKIVRNALGETVVVNKFGMRTGKVGSNGNITGHFGKVKGIYMGGTIYKTDRKGNIKSPKIPNTFFN